jgi:hypothetical protein
VIDDGSSDLTRGIALEHAREDARLQVLSQVNSGAAVARNRGIALATGTFVAPLDADDLWHPTKIAKQLEAYHRGGRRVGLVYTWFASVSEDGFVTSLIHRPTDEGNVLPQMCRGNLIGNGSSALIPKEVLLEVGGYDETKPQFCEDLRLYLTIAERYDFAVVAEHLTGYRQRRTSISSDVMSMLCFYEDVTRDFLPKYPQHLREFQLGRSHMLVWLARKALKCGNIRDFTVLAAKACIHDPSFARRNMLRRSPRDVARDLAGVGPVRFFQPEAAAPAPVAPASIEAPICASTL